MPSLLGNEGYLHPNFLQQNPDQLLTDQYNPPQSPMAVNDPQMIDPQRMAYAAAMQNIGSIFLKQAPTANISGAYMNAKQYNDRARGNAADAKRREDEGARQAELDDLNRRNIESQIAKRGLPDKGRLDTANIMDYEYFRELPKENKSEYLTMRRADRFYDQGGVQMRAPQLGGGGAQVVAPQSMIGEGGAPTQPEMQQILAQQDADAAKMLAQAKTSESISSGYFERLQPIKEGIGRLGRAIELIDEGADTGPIMSMMPSFSAASQELDNLQSQLGLDVVSNTTFGALSAGELKMALDVAIPSKMDEKDLRVWLTNKRDAQTKLKNYLEEAAMFLSRPGNTQADWAASQRDSENKKSTKANNARLDELSSKYGI